MCRGAGAGHCVGHGCLVHGSVFAVAHFVMLCHAPVHPCNASHQCCGVWVPSDGCRNMVVTFLQAYRVVVLPVANTWMSWSLLHKMSIAPSGPLIALLGIVLLACIVVGLQVWAGVRARVAVAMCACQGLHMHQPALTLSETPSDCPCAAAAVLSLLGAGPLLPACTVAAGQCAVCGHVHAGDLRRLF